jgi:hypothetical protein
LYKNIHQNKPGRPPVELNVNLQLALHNLCISLAGAQRFLACLGLPSPAACTLQKSANKFGPKMEEENERYMSEKREMVKDILELRGMPRDTPIHAEYDRQYNNSLRTGRTVRKPILLLLLQAEICW